jgi:outer membrane protein TolC
MLVGVFQLLQAKQNEALARRDFIDAQRDYWAARNDLDRALNGIATDPTFRSTTDQRFGKRTSTTSPEGGH